jgi:ABC-type transport system involved in cytochrome bd biosynthesis fused ATPase/permease subunit
LLDEIASGLDTLSEKETLEYFLHLPFHPTILFITHRLPDGLRVDRYLSVNESGYIDSTKVNA